jgi:hypothetical protein
VIIMRKINAAQQIIEDDLTSLVYFQMHENFAFVNVLVDLGLPISLLITQSIYWSVERSTMITKKSNLLLVLVCI